VIYINTIPAQAAQKKGYACYPEDFPHLASGEHFKAWKSGDDWEIETTLNGKSLEKRLKELKSGHIDGVHM